MKRKNLDATRSRLTYNILTNPRLMSHFTRFLEARKPWKYCKPFDEFMTFFLRINSCNAVFEKSVLFFLSRQLNSSAHLRWGFKNFSHDGLRVIVITLLTLLQRSVTTIGHVSRYVINAPPIVSPKIYPNCRFYIIPKIIVIAGQLHSK